MDEGDDADHLHAFFQADQKVIGQVPVAVPLAPPTLDEFDAVGARALDAAEPPAEMQESQVANPFGASVPAATLVRY
jgi:hypothetical protein